MKIRLVLLMLLHVDRETETDGAFSMQRLVLAPETISCYGVKGWISNASFSTEPPF
jgi:hypothetical protein